GSLVTAGVPAVAGELVVVPDELAGLDVERERRIAVEIGRRGEGNGVGTAVARKPRIGVRIGDAPVEDLALGIIGARQAPRPRRALLDRHVGPGVAAGLAGRGGGVELPDFLAGLGVVRGDEAVRAHALLAGPVRDDLAVGDEHAAGGLAAVVNLGLPAQLPGLGVDRHQEAVGRGEIDHVLVDAEALAARGAAVDPLWIFARVLPDQIAVGGVDRLD